ncbi:uncharacterized protein LOC143290426 [Babylonia areolata]|uniref:uncharacterized protein LOC143290426 n=1 Tax=Babylonia areolata TaxID=304850 RepID=UPI003FD1DF22
MTEVETLTVEINNDQGLACVHFKELAYDDFGSSETLRPHKLSRLFEAGRVMPLKKGFLEGPTVITKDYGLFVLGLHYTFHPALWSVRRGHTFPFKIETQLQDIGQSSATLQSRLVNTLDNSSLSTLDFKYVYVNRHSGQSSPLPGWLVQKYRSVLKERRQLQLSKDMPVVPAWAYMYDVRVSESDTDHNGHTNQASYIRFCSDATHAAVKEGRLPRLQPSAWHFPLLKLQAMHSGETWMGDKLQVSLWQQEDCRDTIRYIIRRMQGDGEDKVVFHASIVFGQQSHL